MRVSDELEYAIRKMKNYSFYDFDNYKLRRNELFC